MTRLASLKTHRLFEELTTWLGFIQSDHCEDRDRRVFIAEILPKFVEFLPEFMQALNQASSDPLEGEHRHFVGPRLITPPPQAPEPNYEYLSARVRRVDGDDGTRERQCIGPTIGARGRCVGRGAATSGWQPEVADNFARKRSQFQARCKICDSHRSGGRQRQLTRRSAAARHWLELSETLSATDLNAETQRQLLKLSVSMLEEIRHDWWNSLHHQAYRLVNVRSRNQEDPAEPLWYAVDVDQKLVFEGLSPEAALKSAGPESEDRLLIVVPRQ